MGMLVMFWLLHVNIPILIIFLFSSLNVSWLLWKFYSTKKAVSILSTASFEIISNS